MGIIKNTKKLLTNIAVIVTLCALLTAGILALQPQFDNSGTQQVLQSKQTNRVVYSGEEGKTVLELLKKHAEVKLSSLGANSDIASINGMQADTENDKQWLFYVNGQRPTQAASDYFTKSNEVIEWRLE